MQSSTTEACFCQRLDISHDHFVVFTCRLTAMNRRCHFGWKGWKVDALALTGLAEWAASVCCRLNQEDKLQDHNTGQDSCAHLTISLHTDLHGTLITGKLTGGGAHTVVPWDSSQVTKVTSNRKAEPAWHTPSVATTEKKPAPFLLLIS